MAGKTTRRRPTKAEVAAIQRMIDQNADSVWFKRWEAAMPAAVMAYAKAVRQAADQAIDKYAQGLKSFALNKAMHGKQRPGA